MSTQSDFVVLYFTGLSIIGSCFVISSIVLTCFIYKSHKHFGGCSTCCNDKITLFSGLTMLTSLPYMFGDFFRLYFGDNDGWYTSPQWLITFDNICYYTSIILLYLSLILRLYYMFKYDKQYRLSKYQIICLISAITFDIIALSLYLLCVHLAETNTELPSFDIIGTQLTTTTLLAGLLLISNDILINSIVLYLILKRLFRMIENLNEKYQCMLETSLSINNIPIELEVKKENSLVYSLMSEESELEHLDINDDDADNLKRNKNAQQEIAHLMTKLSLLTMICVIVSQLVNFDGPYLMYMIETENVSSIWFNKNIITGLVFRAIESTVNCITLMLTFVFYQKQYNQCCHVCHVTLANCLTKCIAKRIYNKRVKYNKNKF